MSKRRLFNTIPDSERLNAKLQLMQRVILRGYNHNRPNQYKLSFKPQEYQKLPQKEYQTSVQNNGLNQRKNIHIGQTKLLLSEILFLTKELRNRTDDQVLCVYAGAAPGPESHGVSHLPELINNFPNTKWLLCDPRFCEQDYNTFHDLITRNQVQIFDKMFDTSVAKDILNFTDGKEHSENSVQTCLQNLQLNSVLHNNWKRNILFISDIRRDFEKEDLVWEDMELQKKCFQILQARAGLFKFRPPYPSTVPYENFNETIQYLDGEIFWPVYGCAQTTECRLYVQKDASDTTYDCRMHQNVLYAFNCDKRPQFDEWAEQQIYLEFYQKFNCQFNKKRKR